MNEAFVAWMGSFTKAVKSVVTAGRCMGNSAASYDLVKLLQLANVLQYVTCAECILSPAC